MTGKNKKINLVVSLIALITFIFTNFSYSAERNYSDFLRVPLLSASAKTVKTGKTFNNRLNEKMGDSAANLFFASGQETGESKKMELQLVLKILLKENKNVKTIENIRKGTEALFVSHNVLPEGGKIDNVFVENLLKELASSGLIVMKKESGYTVVNARSAAVWANDWEYIRDEIEAVLNNTEGLKDLLLDYEKVCEELWPNDLKEKFDPVLIAVCMLSRKFIDSGIEDNPAVEKELIRRIEDLEASGQNFNDHPIFDAVRFTLLPLSEISDDWPGRYARNLEGATIINVSAEISSLRGGLGRVLFFNTAALSLLLRQKTKLTWVEPYYTDLTDYNINISEDSLYEKFIMKFRGQDVSVKVYKIQKTMEIPDEKGNNIRVKIDDFFITDENHRYVCKQYSYGRSDSIATDDEFTEFFSKAVVEFTNIMASKSEAGWKKSLLRCEDGQCLPIAFFKNLLYTQEPTNYKALGKIPVTGVTHTYPNRIKREFYNLNDARRFLEDTMSIPREYHWICLRKEGERYLVDFTSMGLRTSNLPLSVSAIQGYEMAPLDPSVALKSLTNGDLLSYTSREIDKILRGLYGEDVDTVHLTTEQIIKAKEIMLGKLRDMLLAKREKEGQKNEYHVHGYLEGLNPGQLVVEYAGRLVIEKLDLFGQEVPALTVKNIEDGVKNGTHSIIFGNLQKTDGKSAEFMRELRDLAQKIGDDKGIKKENSEYKGAFIFVDRFTWEEQLMLLAAASLQAQCSWRHTGAAEFTESDAFAVFMLQITTLFHEGITDFGIPFDSTVPGKGTTIKPYANTKEAYAAILKTIGKLFRENPTVYAEYQKTAKLISRALNVVIKEAILVKEYNKLLLKNDVFGIKLEPRSDMFTLKGLELEEKGIHVESLSPGNMSKEAPAINEPISKEEMKVKVTLLIAPGVKIPEVLAHANSYKKDWADYKLDITSIEGNRVTYEAGIPVKDNDGQFKLVFKVGDVWLGESDGRGNIEVDDMPVGNPKTNICL
jgi:hypothetical protein